MWVTRLKLMVTSHKILAPLVILGATAVLAVLINLNAPEAERRAPPSGPRISVEALVIERAPFQVRLQSYGTVRPQTQSALVAQVGGQVVWINPQFRDGGFFNAGDELLRLDARDHEANVKIAEAGLLDAQRLYEEERALGLRALDEWRELGYESEPNDLVLRKPQKMAAEARVASAEASLTKAKLSLERTRLIAPFDGRMLRKEVDLGQVVSPNAQLAHVYATDHVEIRLPLKNSDLGLIDLPEQLKGLGGVVAARPKVTLRSRLGTKQSWEGHLVRTESAIDEVARQLHVVALVEDPFGLVEEDSIPLKIGEYVTAEIEGELLDDAIAIPIRTIYQGSYVYTVVDGTLRRRDISISWQNDQVAIIESGLEVGDQLVLTPLGQVTSGTKVKVVGEETEAPEDGEAESPNRSAQETNRSRS